MSYLLGGCWALASPLKKSIVAFFRLFFKFSPFSLALEASISFLSIASLTFCSTVFGGLGGETGLISTGAGFGTTGAATGLGGSTTGAATGLGGATTGVGLAAGGVSGFETGAGAGAGAGTGLGAGAGVGLTFGVTVGAGFEALGWAGSAVLVVATLAGLLSKARVSVLFVL